MAQPMMESFIGAFGLRTFNDTAVDLVAGCPVSLNFGKRNIRIKTAMEEGQFEAVKDALNASLASSGIGSASFDKGFVQFVLNRFDKATEDYSILRGAIQTYIAPASSQLPCPVCGMGSCDVAAFHDYSENSLISENEFVRTHASCHAKTIEQNRTKISSGDGNYPLGILGAILGAALVLAVCFFIVVLADTVFAILFAAVPFAAGMGYRLFKGPYGTKGILTIVLISILAFAGYIYVECSYFVAVYLDAPISYVLPQFEAVAQTAFSPEYLGGDWFQILAFVTGLVLSVMMNPASAKLALNDIQGLESMVLPLGNQEPSYGTIQEVSANNQPMA